MTEPPSTSKRSKQEHRLFTVTGEKPAGHATALVIDASEAEATYFALTELGFISVSGTYLVSESVYVGPGDLLPDF